MADPRHPDPVVRRAQRVLLMVHELHKRGYQLLRIMPGMSPSGMHWRCTITPKRNILRTHGARVHDYNSLTAHYSSAQGAAYFDWLDAAHDTARQLATKFVDRFPVLAEKGKGRDWEYVGWYVEMLGFAERGVFPIAYADSYAAAPDPGCLPTTAGVVDSGLPMPPGGDALPGEPGPQWQGVESFDEVLRRCYTYGAEVVIGFSGGAVVLATKTLRELDERRFKWDWTEGGRGKKVPKNWIAGDQFAAIVAVINGPPHSGA